MKSPNIKFTSNIYPVKAESIAGDREFQKQIRGKEALKKMVEIIHGRVGNDDICKLYLYDIFEPWQVELYWDLSLPCINAKGDKPFGIVKKDNPKIDCRCEMKSCNLYKQCRPNKEVNN